MSSVGANVWAAMIAVSSLVRLAGGSGVRALPASRTAPLVASTRIHALGGGMMTVVGAWMRGKSAATRIDARVLAMPRG
jgi:hypothetical protein